MHATTDASRHDERLEKVCLYGQPTSNVLYMQPSPAQPSPCSGCHQHERLIGDHPTTTPHPQRDEPTILRRPEGYRSILLPGLPTRLPSYRSQPAFSRASCESCVTVTSICYFVKHTLRCAVSSRIVKSRVVLLRSGG